MTLIELNKKFNLEWQSRGEQNCQPPYYITALSKYGIRIFAYLADKYLRDNNLKNMVANTKDIK